MTESEKTIAVRLRSQGMTYSEIGEVLGVTRQYVHQLIGPKRKGDKFYNQIPYTGWYEIFRDNPDLTVPGFVIDCFGTNSRALIAKIGRMLGGKNVALSLFQIRKILSYTGKTWEELFEKRDCGGKNAKCV